MAIVAEKSDEVADTDLRTVKPIVVRHHFPHLDGLRACLALYVVAVHIYMTVWPGRLPASTPMGLRLALATFMDQGRAAVDWFIVLSGFCLMLPTLRRGYALPRGTIDFYRRRARRILPTYWIAVAFSVLMCLTLVAKNTGTHWDVALPVTWPSALSAIFLTNDIFYIARINHVLWSIAVEWRIYFLFPAILWLWRRSGGKIATAIVAGSVTGLAILLPHLSMKLMFLETTLSYIGLFAMGTYAAYLSCGIDRPFDVQFKRRLMVFAVIATLLALASHARLLPPRLARQSVFDAFYGLAMASWLACWTMPGKSLMRSALSSLSLPFIGVFAFSLYLIHAPIVQLCWQLFVQPSHLVGMPAFVLLFVAGMPITVAAAYLFFLAFERPFLSSRQLLASVEEGATSLENIRFVAGKKSAHPPDAIVTSSNFT